MDSGVLILKRFNGIERFPMIEGVIYRFPRKNGMALNFEFKCGKAIETCDDTREQNVTPRGEVTIFLPGGATGRCPL